MAKSMLRVVVVGLAGGLLLAPSAWAGTHPHQRTGFMIGFGVGGGSVGLDVKDVSGESREGGAAGSFRLGYAVRPDLVLGLESSAWTKTFTEGGGPDVTWTFSTVTAALTLFPAAAPGFFLRGGVGLGTARVDLTFGRPTVSASETGLGLLVGAGYEWRLSQKFALGPQVEFAYQNEGGDVQSSNVISGGLELNWYW